MTRLCIVARGSPTLYGYLMVALERELEGPNRMEIIFDRRRPAAPPGGAPLGMERRTHLAVEQALQTQGYVILDENGNVAAPEKLRASREAVLLWKSAAGWADERMRSAWQARPATATVVKLAGVVGALAVSAVLVAEQFPTRADRQVVLRRAESRMASAPAQTAMVASPPAVAAPPAPVVAPPEPKTGPGVLVASTPAPAVVESEPADRPPAPALPPMRRTPAAAPPNPTPQPSTRSRTEASRPAVASVTTPARESAPASEEPTVVLETDPQGKGNERRITYTASVLDPSGDPLTNADVSLLGWMPDGSDLKTPLGPTSTPGTYQGSVEVGVSTPGNLRVRIAHGGKSFDIAPQRRQY
jgi:YtkA-like